MKRIIKLFLIITLAFTVTFTYVKADPEEDPGQVEQTLITSAPVVSVRCNNNNLILSWEAVENATSYVIERSTNAKKGFKKIATVTTTTYTDKKLNYGTTYYYKVTARGPQNKKTSSVVSKKVVPNKVTVTNLRPGSTQVKITWNKTSNSGYYIYRSTDGKKWTKIATIKKNKTTTYTDKKLKSNKKYYYQVQAYQTVKRKTYTGSRSAVMEVVTSPAAPNFKVSSAYVNGIWFTVKKVSGAVRYEVYYAASKKSAYTHLGDIEPADFANDYDYDNNQFKMILYVDKPYTQQYYKVRACSEVSCGSFTASNAQAQLEKNTIESARGEKKAVALEWQYTSGADGYEVWRSTSKNGKYTKVKTISGGGNVSYKDKGVKSAKTYYYKIRSYIKIGKKNYYSAYSAIRKVKTGKNVGIENAFEDAKILNKLYYPSKTGLISMLVEGYGYSQNDAKKGVEKAKINYKENALKTAKEWLEWDYIVSEDELRNDLMESGFTLAEANYAVSKVDANWEENLRSAIEEMITYRGVSRTWLITRYANDNTGYSENQVITVINALNIDFNEQAYIAAQRYMDGYYEWSSSTRISNVLDDEGFTEEEIQYAIVNCNIDWIGEAVKAYEEIEDQLLSRAAVEELMTNEDYLFTLEEIAGALERLNVNFNTIALEKANELVEHGTYSQTELSNALTELGFTTENITYVLENGEFDFDAMALTTARNLMYNSGYEFTRVQMRNTLESRNFTEANITYAIEGIGSYYWQESALKNAIEYVDHINKTEHRGLSRARSIETLAAQDYTTEEINYARENIGSTDEDFFGKQAILSATYKLDNYILSESELRQVLENSDLYQPNEVNML